jgi:hypothetical protein
MGELVKLLSENALFFLISGVALLIIQGMLAWWAIAQTINSDVSYRMGYKTRRLRDNVNYGWCMFTTTVHH